MRQAFKREEGRGFQVGEKYEGGGGGKDGGQAGREGWPNSIVPFQWIPDTWLHININKAKFRR